MFLKLNINKNDESITGGDILSYSFQKSYTLEPHSPLIHFQHEQEGATLRATEVKPKLDRYIEKHCKDVDEKWRISKDQQALNYKMQISLIEKSEKVDLGQHTNYDIFYGNMGDAPKKRGVIAKAKLTITCFIPELFEKIDEEIGDFFIVTNFGTMQDKGFGSFTVENKDCTPNHICSVLKREYSAKHCYMFRSMSPNTFKQIKTVYSLMKSGVNFGAYERSLLFSYMHKEYHFGNEKAWLKQQGIAPAIGRSTNQMDKKSYYVRALLGIGDHIEFLKDPHNTRDKLTVTISNTDSDAIERLASPILFKVIQGTVYFVTNRINKSIYGSSFKFESPEGSGVLKVPTEEELGKNFIDEFLRFCYPKINSCSQKFRDIKNIIIREV